MKLQDVDKRFIVNETITENGIKRYNIPHSSFDLYGIFYDEKNGRFMRMDKDIADQVNEGVKILAMHTCGGRLRFSTDSDKLEIIVTYAELWRMSHMALEGSGGFMLVEENEDGSTGFYKMLSPTFDQLNGYTLSVHLPTGKMRNYILWFPLYNQVTGLTIGLDEKATVTSGRKYKEMKPILYYGNSITQGGCASRPDNAYASLISKWNNIDFINLGFSGSGKAEDIMVDYLTTVDCSLFVCDYDHNAPDAGYLEQTHYRLYERYRQVRKDVPILFLTAPTDEPRDMDERAARYKVIKKTYDRAKKQGDQNVYFMDGRKLLNMADRMNCTVDGTHPTDLGFYYIAKKIYKKLGQIDKKFQ